jgi:hypothetical protein
MHTRAASFIAPFFLLSIAGCATAQIRERQRISGPLVGCDPEEILITELGSWEWYAQCNHTAYRCTIAGRTQTECMPVEASSGGSATSPAAEAPDADVAVETSPELTSTEPEGSEDVRAAIESRRDAILACVDAPPVGISLTIEADGTMRIRLTGQHADSSAEECVRHVLDDLHVEGGSRAGETLIHVIR